MHWFPTPSSACSELSCCKDCLRVCTACGAEVASSELDEEFSDLYPEEYQNLRVLGLLIEKLATSPTSRKMDFGEFIENCSMRLKDEDGDDLLIDGKEVAEELAKVLEKSDVVKVKGDKVKWKSER